ncbi:class I SAM-dependent methyltransferase [Bradyrhizobium sp.]|uniref:class I SAM-dependent methyltransferase n=1 Tax=Bradyrhizobium sp. TaxID=376 RepID=UPI002BCAA09A|nr:class I SAM-dependent methyltransferase [Bradyrhizobium sp.]HMM91312.1 class I SAM-dependent methyltransferase [Bradyrhizobium sp.]
MASEEAARIVDLYQRKASDWIESRSRTGSLEKPWFERPWLDRFRALLPPAGPILDLGCGSAEPMAAYLIGLGHPVTGVDSAPAMIDACRMRFPEQEWIVGDMRTLALKRTFSGILGWDGFFHLCQEDQRLMFPLFAAHAAPGAALLFTSGPAHGEAIGEFAGEPLYHASLAADEYRVLLDRNGFGVVSHVVEDPDCGGHTIWLAQRM